MVTLSEFLLSPQLSQLLTGSELMISLNLALFVGGSEHFSAQLVKYSELMLGSY